jgi:hypothetical protein
VPYIQHDEANATPAEVCTILERAAQEITHVIGGCSPGKKRILPHPSAD